MNIIITLVSSMLLFSATSILAQENMSNAEFEEISSALIKVETFLDDETKRSLLRFQKRIEEVQQLGIDAKLKREKSEESFIEYKNKIENVGKTREEEFNKIISKCLESNSGP